MKVLKGQLEVFRKSFHGLLLTIKNHNLEIYQSIPFSLPGRH